MVQFGILYMVGLLLAIAALGTGLIISLYCVYALRGGIQSFRRWLDRLGGL